MIKNKKELGDIGEYISSIYLKEHGYKILEKNFKIKQGEIDIIAKDRSEYVFVEVKTRSNFYYGIPREAVDYYKKQHIYKCAEYYLYIHSLNNVFVRFDVIEIYYNWKNFKIKHLKDVEIKL